MTARNTFHEAGNELKNPEGRRFPDREELENLGQGHRRLSKYREQTRGKREKGKGCHFLGAQRGSRTNWSGTEAGRGDWPDQERVARRLSFQFGAGLETDQEPGKKNVLKSTALDGKGHFSRQGLVKVVALPRFTRALDEGRPGDHILIGQGGSLYKEERTKYFKGQRKTAKILADAASKYLLLNPPPDFLGGRGEPRRREVWGKGKGIRKAWSKARTVTCGAKNKEGGETAETEGQ